MADPKEPKSPDDGAKTGTDGGDWSAEQTGATTTTDRKDIGGNFSEESRSRESGSEIDMDHDVSQSER